MSTISFPLAALLLLILGDLCLAAKNATLNREIDIELFRIQKAIKSRSLVEFRKYFHDEFDADAWFNRYYSQLTEDQLESYTIRRFSNVDIINDNTYQFKYSESRISTKPPFLLRSWLATTGVMPKNRYAIKDLVRVDGEEPGEQGHQWGK